MKQYKNRHLRPSKSGDEVLRQLDADEAIVFRLVGSDVRATPRMSRSEAWQQWMHDNPGDFARLLAEHYEREAQREHDAHRAAQALEACEAEELAYALSVAREAPEWPEEASPHDEREEASSATLGAATLPFDVSALPLPDFDALSSAPINASRQALPGRGRWSATRDPRRYRARTALPVQAFMCDTRTHYGR